MSESVRAILARLDPVGEPFPVDGNPFRLVHRLSAAATREEIEEWWPGRPLPQSLLDLWSVTRTAELFIDADFGQWGLRLLSPEASAGRTGEWLARRSDSERDDIVIGEFLGDLELLVIEAGGTVAIALPLDPRGVWPRPAGDLAMFLASYLEARGDKFWERHPEATTR